MSTANVKRVLIIGGGPGGLTAAIGLRREGITPAVYERAGQEQVGSGLTLWPNAIQALDTLALGMKVVAVGLALEGIEMFHWRGQPLFAIAPEVMAAHFGGAGLALYRWELMAALLKELGDGVIHSGLCCTGFRQDGRGVTAFFNNGSQARGDILIGADGIHSLIRDRLLGRSRFSYSGYTVWRGIADFELRRNIGVTSLGQGAQFGYFPLPRQRVYWFASANTAEREGEAIRRKDALLGRFSGWHEPVRALLESTDEAAILRHPVYEMDPIDRWSDGRVALLGDAAHPFAPTLGQGACQAIEDAAVLVKCLSEDHDVASALRAYGARRAKRAKTITAQSRWIGQMGQWENSLACWLRDSFIKSTPEPVRLRQLAWMFRFEA